MAKNDFKAFAIGENANTLSQEEYESADFIEEGFKSGIARSERLNKVWRQSSVIAAVIGKYIAEKTGEDVMDDGDLEKLVAQLDLALKHKITTEIPDASLTQKGISQLNSATNSDREDQAATPKAVHDVRKIAESKLSGVSDASLTQKGVVQLSSATNSTSETLAATPKAVKNAYDFANTANVAAKNAHDEANRATDNANSRLAKNQNGADIPNKSEFIKNLGLVETVNKANNAVSKTDADSTYARKKSQDEFTCGSLNVVANHEYPGIKLEKKDGRYVQIYANPDGQDPLTISYRDKNGDTIYYASVQKKSGMLAMLDDINVPVGVPLPYPHRYTPAGYLTCNGQSFDKSLYPMLAEAYPAGRVPDLRGEFIRGWDDSRGVDPGRVCGSCQGDALQNIIGGFTIRRHRSWSQLENVTGCFDRKFNSSSGLAVNQSAGETGADNVTFDASRVVRTANETRPRNIAFNYIVRAA
ncbi:MULTISPECIES: phage tail protein [unclassified Photorhabdus]|uniref:phage tail protein n=1 Tax=unclassified Photorhabdus TaxID=2620880 RepID=UPI000DCAF628|nr:MULTISPECIES: phage tail protein [unclassified Photorhabdus]RAW99016.1 phage tail protein [Photorhabdus sp. S10-54]RAW99054.1 phage tail protein [Photorhabdus sp. S9-53]RAX03300.1 phage tail protein [Photorhabdus sp. S8-52]